MKIITKNGNLLTNVYSGHVVHGCNARGVMGSGFALAIKNMYPTVYEDYRDIHDKDGLILGNAYPVMPTEKLIIWNAITQENCGSDGKRYVSYDAIETCFKQINESIPHILESEVSQEIHIPLLGAGLGGGNWEIIREIIEQTVVFPTTLWLLK